MIRKSCVVLCLLVASGFASAQTADVSVCDVLSHPQSYDGKIVRIKGVVIAGFDEFAIRDASCKQPVNAIWLSYPEGIKGKAGAAIVLTLQLAKNSPGPADAVQRTPVKLDANKDFKQFDAALSTPTKVSGRCLGCMRSTVTATLTGRVDAVEKPALERNSDGKFTAIRGFGNMNRYPARLVLMSVADVAPSDIDYSHPAAAGSPVGLTLDPEQAKRGIAAFGAEGDDNGVVITFGGGNTVPSQEGSKATSNSPDGLILTVIFGGDVSKGAPMSEAMVHAGVHIADLRDGKSGSLFDLEAHAWGATLVSALGQGDRVVTLPGGYPLWNNGWSDADKQKLIPVAVGGFLTDWSGLGH